MIILHFHLQPQYNMNFIYISQRKIKEAICNVPVECDKICQNLPRAPASSGIILLRLKRLQFRGHVYLVYQAVRPEVLLYALNWLVANKLSKTITIDTDKLDRNLTNLRNTRQFLSVL